MSNPFAAAAGVLARSVLGADATYTPPGGAAVTVRIVPFREEGDVLPGPARLSAAGYAAMLPVSQVPNRPPRDSELVIKGRAFTVEVAELDPRGAYWRLTLREP